MQAKLLSVLQTRVIARVGDNKSIKIDARLISATNMQLAKMIGEGKFREDLLYRINTIHIDLPPLRERLEDIPFLAQHFLSNFRAKYKKSNLTIKKSTLERMQKHPWPGNIRELEHTIEKAVIMATGEVITPDDLMFERPEATGEILKESYNLLENEKILIEKALKSFGGNLSKTARELGINRSTLYDKMKKYEL
jgi:DNA-binding NtrC family response regulator